MFVDTHIHFTHKDFDNEVPCIVSSDNNERVKHMTRIQLIDEIKNNNIEYCIEPAIELESNYRILELSQKYPNFIYPAIGLHPKCTFSTKWKSRKEICNLLNNDNVIAVGEIGLDYHYKELKRHKLRQKLWFIYLLKQAYKNNLPVILHIRDADKDAIKILRKYKKYITSGICHCFNSDYESARIYTQELGFMLGIGGMILQEDCSKLEDVIKKIPLEYIVLETDGPYVKPIKPEAKSKKQWEKARNTSLIIRDIANQLSIIKGVSTEEIETITTNNSKKYFQLINRYKK